MEKAFDKVAQKVEEWIIVMVKAMCTNARSREMVNGTYHEEFEVKVGVLQGFLLLPLLLLWCWKLC